MFLELCSKIANLEFELLATTLKFFGLLFTESEWDSSKLYFFLFLKKPDVNLDFFSQLIRHFQILFLNILFFPPNKFEIN